MWLDLVAHKHQKGPHMPNWYATVELWSNVAAHVQADTTPHAWRVIRIARTVVLLVARRSTHDHTSFHISTGCIEFLARFGGIGCVPILKMVNS